MKQAIMFVIAAGAFLASFANAAIPSTPSAPVAIAAPYVLAPGDQLDISVLNHDDRKATVTVLPDGTITVPTLGQLTAAGLTIQQLTDELTKLFSVDLNMPRVSVIALSTKAEKVSVLGDVKSPGIYDYHPGWHIVDVMAACGGAAQDPNMTKATLVSGVTSTHIDVGKLMEGDTADNVAVNPGDVLLVEARDPADAQVQVIGEVDHPGMFSVPADGASVLSLITQAGGGTPKASLSNVQLMHGGVVQTINIHEMMTSIGNSVSAPNAMPGDTIDVLTNTAHVFLFGEVHNQGQFDIPDGDSLTVLGAITESGGYTTEADLKSVTVARRTATGTEPTQIKMDLRPYLTGSTTAECPTLQPGDIVYVPTRKHTKSFTDALQALSPLSLVLALAK